MNAGGRAWSENDAADFNVDGADAEAPQPATPRQKRNPNNVFHVFGEFAGGAGPNSAPGVAP